MGYRNFNYSFPTKYIYGKNSIDKLKEELRVWKAKRIVVLCGKSSSQKLGIHDYIKELFERQSIKYLLITDCKQNPDTEFVNKCKTQTEKFEADFMLAIGGGSVIDTAKAVIFGLKDRQRMNLGVILTIPASGSECNSSFVIKNEVSGVKIAKASAYVIPKFSICDITYMNTLNTTQLLTACSDIMAHLLEQLFAEEKWGFIDFQILGCMLAMDKAVDEILLEKRSQEVLETIMLSSSFALSYFLSCGKSMDWIGHTFEHALAGIYESTHGISLSVIMPKWVSYASQRNEAYREKLEVLGNYLQKSENPEQAGVSFVLEYYSKLGFPKTLSECVGRKIDYGKLLEFIFERETIGKNYILCKEEGKKVLDIMG